MALKILLLSHNFYPFLGGIEVISDALATNFTKEGHEVHLVTWTTEKSKKSFPFKVLRKPDLLTLFREHFWADVVFENNPCLRLSWPAIFFNTPTIVSLQTWICKKKAKRSVIERIKLLWLRRAKKVIACSNPVKDKCWPASIVIGNPYQEKLFKKMENITRDRDFVFVGRMVSDKGAELAIRALGIINGQINGEIRPLQKIKMTMVGDGSEKRNLQKLSSELSLNSQIEFTGPLEGEALVTCLNRHRFIVVPSLWEEPFGIVVLEGLACGCFPIVSNGGGLPEAVGRSGLLFRRGDVNELVECMRKVINSPEIIKEYVEEGKQHLTFHRSEKVANDYLEEIKDALKINKKMNVAVPQLKDKVPNISVPNN